MRLFCRKIDEIKVGFPLAMFDYQRVGNNQKMLDISGNSKD